MRRTSTFSAANLKLAVCITLHPLLDPSVTPRLLRSNPSHRHTLSIFQVRWSRSGFRCDGDKTEVKRRGHQVPCLARGAAMSGLKLLLGLLACAPLLVRAQSPPLFLITEMCHHALNIDYIEHHLGNFSARMLPPEGKRRWFIALLFP